MDDSLSPRRAVAHSTTTSRVPETFGGRAVRIPSILNCVIAAAFYAAIAFTFSVLAESSIYHQFQPLDNAATAVLIGVFAFLAKHGERTRKQFTLHRFKIIGEANHHIRNAVQAIVYINHSDGGASSQAKIKEHVQRIQWVLDEILPEVTKDDDEWDAGRARPTIFDKDRISV